MVDPICGIPHLRPRKPPQMFAAKNHVVQSLIAPSMLAKLKQEAVEKYGAGNVFVIDDSVFVRFTKAANKGVPPPKLCDKCDDHGIVFDFDGTPSGNPVTCPHCGGKGKIC